MKANPHLYLEVVACVLLLSACRSVVDTRVNANGSGDLSTSVVYTAQEQENFSHAPGNESKGICDNLRAGVPADATFSQEERNGETYCVTTRSFANLRELRGLYAGMKDVRVNTLDFDSGRLVFDVEVDLSQAKPGEAGSSEWQLTLPGRLGMHNADQVEGQMLTWMIAPGEKIDLHAESTLGLDLVTLGPAGQGLLAGVCILLIAGGAIGIILVRRGRQLHASKT